MAILGLESAPVLLLRSMVTCNSIGLGFVGCFLTDFPGARGFSVSLRSHGAGAALRFPTHCFCPGSQVLVPPVPSAEPNPRFNEDATRASFCFLEAFVLSFINAVSRKPTLRMLSVSRYWAIYESKKYQNSSLYKLIDHDEREFLLTEDD